MSSRSLTFQFQGVGFLAMEVCKVFTQDKVLCKRAVQQIVDIPVPGGGPQDFLPESWFGSCFRSFA